MDIGSRIKELRISKNKTAKELSKLINISQSSLSKLENNVRKADICTLNKICEALDISISNFFNYNLSAEEIKFLSILKKMKKEQKNLIIEIAKNFI